MKKIPTLLTKQIRAERINKPVLAHGTGAPRKVKLSILWSVKGSTN